MFLVNEQVAEGSKIVCHMTMRLAGALYYSTLRTCALVKDLRSYKSHLIAIELKPVQFGIYSNVFF